MAEPFQRARTEEQRAARRQAILDTTRGLVEQRDVAGVSLNEIAREVGLAKSNVLRYFESREAILLALLVDEYHAWVGQVVVALEPGSDSSAPGPDTDPSDRGTPEAGVADVIARTVLDRPLLCELLSVMPTVLEHNLSPELAMHHRSELVAASSRLLAAVEPVLGRYDRQQARGFLVAMHAFVVMVWSAQRPSPGVAEAFARNPELKSLHMPPRIALREFLTVFLVGLRHHSPRFPDKPQRLTGTGQPERQAG